ncbi:uncharacterized protein [Amphiura filiformis]|uniref:uncharacterized protein n=1 Tax=Amphiura filiformis TaxID=82378 RepID=UPI003B21A0CE
MGLRSHREIRVALYAFFLGLIIAFIISRLVLISPKHKRTRKLESNGCKPERTNIDYRDGANQLANECPECPEPICPLCPESPLHIPYTMEQFIVKHIVDLKEGPLVITRTRMKSVESFFLSLHPSERDMQISHQLTTRGDWNDQLIGTVCHAMHSAPKDSYFVDVGAYVGALAFGVAQCGFNVAAFEPYSHTFRLLQESMALNHFDSDRVKLYNMALGNATGKACLAASSSDRSMARIYRSRDECRNDQVTIDKLDRVMKGATIWYLYMDTGGFEPAILTGARSFLTGPEPPKYIHFKASHSGFTKEVMGTKMDLAGTLKWLDQIGYSLRDGSNEPIRSIDEFVMELGHQAEDVIAIYHKNQQHLEV